MVEDLKVEEHRLEIEGTELESYLDNMCEKVRVHPEFGVGDRLLDWRYNKGDLEKLQSCIEVWFDFQTDPCPICGDPLHICERNPDTKHICWVVGDDGEVIGESKSVYGDIEWEWFFRITQKYPHVYPLNFHPGNPFFCDSMEKGYEVSIGEL